MMLNLDYPSINRAARHGAKIAKILTALLTPLLSRRAARRASLDTLSAHQLRDIGIERGPQSWPTGFALTDLAMHTRVFDHPNRGLQ